MRISDISSTAKSPKTKRKESQEKSSGFLEETASHTENSAATSVSTTHAINPFFSLQEVEDDHKKDDTALEYGYDILEQLEAIKLGLLNGSLNMETLHRIDRSIAGWKKMYQSPKLKQIIEEIELRAKVEHAKLDKYL